MVSRLWGILGPVWPFLDDGIEGSSWTLGRDELTMAKQPIVLAEFPQIHAPLDYLLGGQKLSFRGRILREGPNEGDADAVHVEALRVSSHFIPSASLVSWSIATHQEVVADVIPAARFHVEGLDEADSIDAAGLELQENPRF